MLRIVFCLVLTTLYVRGNVAAAEVDDSKHFKRTVIDEGSERKNYEQLQASLRNFDERSESALIVIDTDQEAAQNKKKTATEKRSSISQRSGGGAGSFDDGFTIIIDRDNRYEVEIKKDQIYQEMEENYAEIQEKFNSEIKQPVQEKHVRVIVITPKEGEDETKKLLVKKNRKYSSTSSDRASPSELDLDIEKLQKVRDQMSKLNSEEKNSDSSVVSKNKNNNNNNNTPTPSQQLIEEMERQRNEASGNRNGENFDQSQQFYFDSTSSSTLNNNETSKKTSPVAENKTSTSLKTGLKTVITKTKFSIPPSNPHPLVNYVNEHYKTKHLHTKSAEKKSSTTKKEEEDDLITERPKLPANFKLGNSSSSSSTSTSSTHSNDSGMMGEGKDNSSSSSNIMEEHLNPPVKTNKTNNMIGETHQNKQPSKTAESFQAKQPNIMKEAAERKLPFNNGTRNDTKATTKLKDVKAVGGVGSNSSLTNKTALPRVITTNKAEAIIQFLNKDPLESWRYPFNTLKSLNLDAGLIRTGLVYPGYIERLKGVMRRAIMGKDIILSIVGGSISAGGGLYKDHHSIEGLYYKGVVDWWNQWIFPVTGSKMKVNNIAVGSIGTDYFSYCVKNHIKPNTDLVVWELAANDFNRYKTFATKGARPLERFTRMVLDLPSKPALLYVNFFKGIDYKNVRTDCPNFEDQQEHTIASYYHIPTLSWRTMVCSGLVQQKPGFLLKDLFSLDQYHPSLKGHAQTALLILLHLRHVMRAVLQYAIKHDGQISKFEDLYNLPDPLFIGPKHPETFCWTLIKPDEKDPVRNSIEVSVAENNGFKIEYATNFPIRFDKVICYKSEKTERPTSNLKLVFTIPRNAETRDKRFEIAITTHSKWGGSSMIWLDDKNDQPVFIQEGRPGDPGKRTQVDTIASDVAAGTHFLNFWSKDGGFCLAAIMVDAS